jgi:hypothetical protein
MKIRNAEILGSAVLTIACLAVSLIALPIAAQQRPAGTPPGDLKGGEFVWNSDASPAGPVVVVVSLSEQFAYVYRNGVLIAYCPVATGKPGHETPTGVFTILQKDKDHVSSIYKAKMPYTERLTWSGICLHAGSIPGYPNSHGCVHLPLEFSHLLFELEELGATVVIADDHSGPAEAAHPGMLLSPVLHEDHDFGPSAKAGIHQWEPELSPEGPVTLLLSAADHKLYVYRNGIEIGVAELAIAKPEQPLDEGVFAVLEGYAEGESALKKDQPVHRWVKVSPASDVAAEAEAGDILKRVRMSPYFAARVYDVLAPGTTMVITNLAATPDTTTDTDFVIMATQHPH